MILQLEPTVPLTTPKGKGFALLVLDYGQEHDLIWVVADDATHEIWAWGNREVRIQPNVTMERMPCRT